MAGSVVRLASLFSFFVWLGCTAWADVQLPAYGILGAHLKAIRAIPAAISLGPFSSTAEDVSCRLSGISPPQGATYAQYIHDALYSEIDAAGIDTPLPRTITLSGTLKSIDVDCGMNEGTWTIEMAITIDNGAPITIRSTQTFDGAFLGEVVIDNARDAFVPATQTLIGDILKTVAKTVQATGPQLVQAAPTPSPVPPAAGATANSTVSPAPPPPATPAAANPNIPPPPPPFATAVAVPSAGKRLAIRVLARCPSDPDPFGIVDSSFYSSCEQDELDKVKAWIAAELTRRGTFASIGGDNPDLVLTVTLTQSEADMGAAGLITDLAPKTIKYTGEYQLADKSGTTLRSGKVHHEDGENLAGDNYEDVEKVFAAKLADEIADGQGSPVQQPQPGPPETGVK
jgi:hypothetical protein